MAYQKANQCPSHGSGLRPELLVGRRLDEVFAAWHRSGDEEAQGPLDVWLIDGQGRSVHVTTGSDWCLIVESASPHERYDMDGWRHVEVAPIGDRTPFAAYLGEAVLAVSEEFEPKTGCITLEVTFASSRIRCDSWAGDLRLSE
ncbi:hypothetical protein [Streptomyces xanthochromogenes]|uniref:DUF1285 domain-containing protein n=1 Tax=Streptomyces xanthochromogenes TaxID=67384 RepID=A0ABQ3ARQ5_9ACTN|nr:hypothetical protein [Streptomyces xanthochromogenes]GGY61973.1 hypothetical protein GCM10010326_66040 [Streptomyces xanthochromogenes]